MQPLFFVIVAVVFGQAMAFPQMMFEMAKKQGLSVEDIAATVTFAPVEKRDTFLRLPRIFEGRVRDSML